MLLVLALLPISVAHLQLLGAAAWFFVTNVKSCRQGIFDDLSTTLGRALWSLRVEADWSQVKFRWTRMIGSLVDALETRGA